MSLINFAKLKSTLSTSKFQRENNALYQTILGLIEGGKKKDDFDEERFLSIITDLTNLRRIVVFEHDTTTGATNYQLDLYVFAPAMVIFKDIGGNASVNNITFTGNVDGIAALPINTNYGISRIYKSPTDGNFYSW